MNIVEKKLGELLRLERERRRLSLQEASTDLKIPEHNLEGIEAGDLSLLPSQIYYNLFARSYAEYLGIDYSRTLEAINAETVDSAKADAAEQSIEPVVTAEIPEENESIFGAELTSTKKIVGVAAILLILFLAYIAVDKLFMTGSADSNGVAEIMKGVDEERLDALANFDWTNTHYDSPTEIRLRLIPRSESWGTVMADGDTAIFRRLIPGGVYDASAHYRLVVSIGVPSAVDIELNGRPVNLRDDYSRRISRVEINQENLREFLKRPMGRTPRSAPKTYSEVITQKQENKNVTANNTENVLGTDTTPSPDFDNQNEL